MMDEISNYLVHRYHFNQGTEPPRQRVGSRQQRERDLEAYQKLKDNNHVEALEDGGYANYIIAIKWIERWRDFIEHKGDMPGKIMNRDLAMDINKQRKDKVYASTDNYINFTTDKEVYYLSYKFWDYFAKAYGCDLEI